MLVYENDLNSIDATVGNDSTLPVIGDADYDRTVVNDAGNTVGVPAEAVRSHGMRIVQNQVPNQNIVNGSGWGRENCTAALSSGWHEITESADTSIHRFRRSQSVIAGKHYIIGATVRPRGRDLVLINAGSLISAKVLFDLDAVTVQDEAQGDGYILDLGDGSFRIYAYGIAATTQSSLFYTQINNTVTTAADDNYLGDGASGFDIKDVDIVDTSSNIDPSLPVEYVSNDVLVSPFHGFGADGYKLFNTANGHTVDVNGAVTAGVGSPLAESTLLGYVSEGPAADGLVIPIDLEAL